MSAHGLGSLGFDRGKFRDKRSKFQRVVRGVWHLSTLPPGQARLRDAGTFGNLGLRHPAFTQALDQFGGLAHAYSLCVLA